MTDRYEKIRKALAMGPTPGPWELKDGRTDTIENAQGYRVCTVHHHPYELYSQGARAAYIAACDPDTIRELLAERDQLAAALEAAQRGLRYAVRVWVLSDEIAWSEEKIDEAVERIIGDAKNEARND